MKFLSIKQREQERKKKERERERMIEIELKSERMRMRDEKKKQNFCEIKLFHDWSPKGDFYISSFKDFSYIFRNPSENYCNCNEKKDFRSSS